MQTITANGIFTRVENYENEDCSIVRKVKVLIYLWNKYKNTNIYMYVTYGPYGFFY